MKIANIDLDGVVYPFHNACRSLAEHWLTYNWLAPKGKGPYVPVRLPSPRSWQMWDEWGMDKDTYHDHFWPWAVEHGVFNQTVPPIHHSREGLNTLREAGYKLRFVTHKPTQGNGFKHHAIRDAVQWLSWNNIEYDAIVFDGDKRDYSADLIVDDNPALERWTQRGRANVLFDQPWNDGVQSDGPEVMRMFGWEQIGQLL